MVQLVGAVDQFGWIAGARWRLGFALSSVKRTRSEGTSVGKTCGRLGPYQITMHMKSKLNVVELPRPSTCSQGAAALLAVIGVRGLGSKRHRSRWARSSSRARHFGSGADLEEAWTGGMLQTPLAASQLWLGQSSSLPHHQTV